MRKIIAACLIFILTIPVTAFAEDERIQGPGFDTCEEAAEAYINGLINSNVSEMLSACAVESYVDGYSLVKHVERMKGLTPATLTGAELPVYDDLSRQLNLEARRTELTDMIRKQYLNLHGYKVISEENAGRMIPMTNGASADELISEMYGEKTVELSYKGEIIPNILLSTNYYSWSMVKNLWQYANVAGADRQGSAAPIVYVNEAPVLLTLGTIQYDGKWYITHTDAIGMLMGMSSLSGNVLPLNVSEEKLAVLDTDAFKLLKQINDEADAIDIGTIMALPEDMREDAYNFQMNALGEKYPDAEEMINEIRDMME